MIPYSDSSQFQEHPQAVLVVHVLPKAQSNEYEWMKTLASRYLNAWTRFPLIAAFLDTDSSAKVYFMTTASVGLKTLTPNRTVFSETCVSGFIAAEQLLSETTGSRLETLLFLRVKCFSTCGILHGKDTKPTFEKVMYNNEDIKESVSKSLHREDEPRSE